ncbi:DUF4271 domain-containing protein [Roseimarinus sediminis]|uniref:DUF4271 domain-containing protein n=1 Tax=Roseimarinus sediminis TaxID=1610899 RepID=UPI003D1C7032
MLPLDFNLSDSVVTINSLPDTLANLQILHFESGVPLSALPKKPYVANWAVLIFVVMMALLAWVRTTSGKYLLSLVQSGINYQTANRLYREKAANIIHPSFRLNLLFFLASSLFLYQVEIHFFHLETYPGLLLFLLNLTLLYAFINIKTVLYELSGFLFKNEQEINEYLFNVDSGHRIIGIFMLPLAVLLFLSEGILLNTLFVLGFAIVLLFSAISLFRGLNILVKKDFSIYYLILYLCTLEILPLLLVWRILWRE